MNSHRSPRGNPSRRYNGLGIARWLLLAIPTIILLMLLPDVLTRPRILAYDDFVVYWATGRLNVQGQNPYDPALLIELERAAGRPLEDALVMWNPPWVVPLVMPMGLLPYPVARTIWFALHFVALAWAFDRLSALSPGPPSSRWLALVIGFTFQPILLALKVGQISPLILAGLVGVLTFFSARPFLAGLFGSLLMVKPQLTYLFFIPLLLWVWKCRCWRFLLGFGIALASATVVALIPNPNILYQYRFTWFRGDAPLWQATPTIGGVLRYFLGPQHLSLQWIVPAIGFLWLLSDIRRRPSWWLQKESIALLAVVSPVIAWYVWMHDIGIALIGLIPAILALVRRPANARRIGLITLYGLINLIALVTSWDQLWYFWFGPALLAWFLLVRRHLLSPLFPKDENR